MALCDAEKVFILHGVEENFRIDGRERGDYRPMELETDFIQTSFGSARLRLANTDVLVSVKIEVDTPLASQPNHGKIEFFVDCSANATPDFEGRGGDDLATEIANSLTSAYRSSNAFDATKLCIYKGKKCWKLYVDVLLLECGGNLYDAVSLAVKAALWDTKIPRIKSVSLDANTVDLEVSDQLSDCGRLDIKNAPVMVTVCKVGDRCIVDPTDAEELCSVGSIVVAVTGTTFSTVLQSGGGSLHVATLVEFLKMGHEVATRLDGALLAILGTIGEENEEVGFLS